MADTGTTAETPQPAGSRPWDARWVAAAVAGIAVAAGAAYHWWPTNHSPDGPAILEQEADEPDEPVAVLNPGYVGPDACAPCHAKRVAEFRTTNHYRACRAPASGPMPPGFEPGKGHYTTLDPGLRFEMDRVGPDYLQTAIQATPAGDRRTTSRIDLVYGANKADEVFFSWRGDELYELMTVWLHPNGCWANTSYNRYGSGEFSRPMTTRCLECHNTWFGHVPGTMNRYNRDTAILGVTCERCHGPGREHVEFHKAHPDEKAAHAVVNPGGLSRDRLTEVCTQCHGNATKSRGPGYSYRPGEPLDAYFRTAVTTHPEQDHVANQVKYLQQSKCFQGSDSLTCVTCHDPHKPHAPDRAASTRSCLECHQPDRCTDRPNLPAAVRDDCIGCHMPPRVWMNVHFHTADDRYVPPIRRYQHRIGKHLVARSEVLLAWHRTQPGAASQAEANRLTAELVGHWLAESAKCRREYRFLAAIGAAREAVRLDPPPPLREKARAALREAVDTQAKLDADLNDALHAADERRFPAAIDTLNAILKVKPDWAVVHSKLGIYYARSGQRDRAVPQLEAVAGYDPDDGSGLIVLGELADADGRYAEAAGFFRRADEIDPFDANINFRWGQSLLRLGRWPDATARFRRVVEIDPTHLGGNQGLSLALREGGQPADAVRYGRRAAKLTGYKQPDVLVTLADAYAAAGRWREAGATAAKVLDLDAARPGGPQLDFGTRIRLAGFRSRTGP